MHVKDASPMHASTGLVVGGGRAEQSSSRSFDVMPRCFLDPR